MPRAPKTGLRQVGPLDADLAGGVGEFLHVVAVSHHPVRIADLVEQFLPVALDFNLLLGAANLKGWVALDEAGEAEPAAGAVFGVEERHLLADRHFHLGRGPVLRLEMRHDILKILNVLMN